MTSERYRQRRKFNLKNKDMLILTTITNEVLRISSNKQKRTFTIRTNSAKYRTLQFSKEEFEHAEFFWTGNDWKQFLKTDDYYKVN